MEVLYISQELKNDAMGKKLLNIETIKNLDRSGLEYQKLERRLLAYANKCGEKIYIQYPGKESNRDNKPRPWDFRPKLIKSNGEMMDDLSFKMIWDDILDLHSRLDENNFRKLAAVFFRMATMADHIRNSGDYEYYNFNTKDNSIVSRGKVHMDWYIFLPEVTDYYDELSNEILKIRGVSLASYLVYNDLLAQNEDNKYFYRDVIERKGNWNGEIGRSNNLMTHASVMQYALGEISFSRILSNLMRGYGVAPISQKDLIVLARGYIKETKKQ